LAGEKALRESGAVYTIVRPGRFFSGPSGERKIVASTCKAYHTFQSNYVFNLLESLPLLYSWSTFPGQE